MPAMSAAAAITQSIADDQSRESCARDDRELGATWSPTRHVESDDFAVDPRQYLPESPPGYDLLRRLGAGGMGTVYLAREHAAERMVAMKLLNSPAAVPRSIGFSSKHVPWPGSIIRISSR